MNIAEQVLEALSRVQDPELRRSITELEMVQDLKESKGQVSLTILLTIAACPMQDRLRKDVTDAVAAVEGVKGVEMSFGVMSEEQRT